MTGIVGNSIWARETCAKIARVAPFTSSVLITGPSGTGKELIARSIHDQSSRAAGPFIPVDCASVPGSLFASQLFGHTEGAFTGATGSTLGSFRAADGGTIFLDEVGELDLELQAKLLRVIQERQVTPVGSHTPLPVDVRIVAATNRDLAKEVKAGTFRMDLFYRLDVVSVRSTAMKDRREDIQPLANFFLRQLADERGMPLKQLSPLAMERMAQYDWPGNVRQLQNIIERSLVLGEDSVIGPEFIPEVEEATRLEPTPSSVRQDSAELASSPAASGDWVSMEENEREHLRRTLEQTNYNQSAAARLLQIDYRLLLRRIKKFGLKKPAHVAHLAFEQQQVATVSHK